MQGSKTAKCACLLLNALRPKTNKKGKQRDRKKRWEVAGVLVTLTVGTASQLSAGVIRLHRGIRARPPQGCYQKYIPRGSG